MAKRKSRHITVSNVDHWASSLGFSYPRSNEEEALFDKLYKDFDHQLTGNEMDPFKLIEDVEAEESQKTKGEGESWKMAARNFGNLPQNIIDKMKKNQDDKTGGKKED